MNTPPDTVRIATRASPMATTQAQKVGDALDKTVAETASELAGTASPPPAPRVTLVPLTTSGDRWAGNLAALGGKGAFVKEIDHALLRDEADIAVHNLKDIPGDVPLPDGVQIAAFPARDRGQDVVVARDDLSPQNGLESLPTGAVVGTSSVRRRAQIRRQWPHLDIRPIRGNANSRLAKLDSGEFDALVLAEVALRRTGLANRITLTLTVDQMLPAVGAGQLAVCARSDRPDVLALCAGVNDRLAAATSRAERALLFELGGHCNSPIAAHCRPLDEHTLALRAAVYAQDGSTAVESEEFGRVDSPESVGVAVADRLRQQGAQELIDATAPDE